MERNDPRVDEEEISVEGPSWVGFDGGRLQLEGGRAVVGVLTGKEVVGREVVVGKVWDRAGADWVGFVIEGGVGDKNA